MSAEHVQVSFADGILTVRLNRPDKKNSLTQDMYATLANAFVCGGEKPQVRAAVICGSGGSFCSGNDLQDFLKIDGDYDDNLPVIRFMRALLHFPKPVVASVEGFAIGIGTTMLQHCDLVYAADNTRFQLPFVNIGICAEFAATYLMPRTMGHQLAAELILTGEPFSAAKAQQAGLVNEVLPAGEVEARAFARAQQLAAQPPNAMRVTKKLMRRWREETLLEACELEGNHFVPMLKLPEAQEAIGAFLEKRKPDFSRFS
jgi:enoyl-CoA hydratase/carnithine racemase